MITVKPICIIKKKFVLSCPTCNQKNKVILKCVNDCGKKICSECNIHGLCKDCYISIYKQKEMGVYFNEKYALDKFYD